MRILKRAITMIILLTAFCAAGCFHYPENPPLTAINTNEGYRYSVVRDDPDGDKPFVLLSFSGGGTRAAAFAFGLMEELRNLEYSKPDGVKRKLLDDVEIISSVSGGSFTSAYYALFPGEFFTKFPDRFLYRNVEGALLLRVCNPYNWFRLAYPDFSRIDMAEEYYNETIFERKTFAELVNRQRGSAPFLVLNATDIGITHRFEFTQDQFDLLCSDLSGVRVSRAVAASSNFPVAFPPMTMNINKQNCGPLPVWIDAAMKDQGLNRRKTDALAALSYRAEGRLYAHLLDGGISDNLGLRGPFQAVTTNDSAWSILNQINRKRLKQLMVIAVNAKTTKHSDWDKTSKPPGITKVLGVVMNGPMDDVSFDSVEMTENHFGYMKQLSDTVNACNNLLKECPAVKPRTNPITTDFTFTELSFDRIPDPRLRRCLQELPTSFYLPRETVDLLRVTAAQLLMTSDSFVKGMQELDPAWRPRTVVIDGKLVDTVCGVQR